MIPPPDVSCVFGRETLVPSSALMYRGALTKDFGVWTADDHSRQAET